SGRKSRPSAVSKGIEAIRRIGRPPRRRSFQDRRIAHEKHIPRIRCPGSEGDTGFDDCGPHGGEPSDPLAQHQLLRSFWRRGNRTPQPGPALLAETSDDALEAPQMGSTIIGRRGQSRPPARPSVCSSCQLQQRVLFRAWRPRTSGAPALGQSQDCDSYPGPMEDEASKQNDLARNGPDGRTLPQLVERKDRHGVDKQLAEIRGYLNAEDPSIVAPQPPACRFQESDVQVRHPIVVIESLVPAALDPNALAAKYRPEKLHLQDMCADAPEI